MNGSSRRALAACALLVGFAIALPLACARNPVSGRPEVVLTSKRGEREIGKAEAARIEELLGTSDDADLQAYVERIGNRLAAVSPRQDAEYRFRVVDTPEPNAFALPGGPIYVSRGLLALLNSEDELAGVLAHEIGHVDARHTVRRLTVAAPFAVIGIPGAILGVVSETLGAVVSAPARLAGGLALSPYSRAQEREADRLGMQFAAKAGWDPDGLIHALATLEAEDTLRRGQPRDADFFDSHPTTPDRLRSLDGYADTLERGPHDPVAPDHDAFLGILDGLLLGPNPKAGVFDESAFLHPVLEVALDFPPGWKLDNQPTVVIAQSPESAGVFALLQLVGQAEDPLAAARVDELDPKLLDRLETTEVNGLPAARLRTERRRTTFDLTWIVHQGRAYRVSGVAPTAGFEAHREVFERVSGSFRALTDEDRERIREHRLRVARGRAGESVAALIRRVDSDWDLAETAVANALGELPAPLAEGQPIKVSIPEAYTPPEPPPAE